MTDLHSLYNQHSEFKKLQKKGRPVRLRAYQAGLGLLQRIPDGSVGSSRARRVRRAMVDCLLPPSNFLMGILPPSRAFCSGTRPLSPVPQSTGQAVVRYPVLTRCTGQSTHGHGKDAARQFTSRTRQDSPFCLLAPRVLRRSPKLCPHLNPRAA